MKRVITSFVATVAAVVALLGFKTHSPEVATASTLTTETTTDSSSSSSSGTVATTTTAASKSTSSQTVTGNSIDTRWGPVQVKVTMKGSKITAIDVVDYPQNNGRDIQINSTAVPELVRQALSAQSASIDGVSGATYTTEGFEQSLQSAISKA